MPTYEYRCAACGHEFELFQQMSDPVKRKCPKCAKSRLERLIGTGAGIIFKGGGFYQTDYRSDSYKKSAEADAKPADSTKPAKTDGKFETKAEAPAVAADSKAETKPSESRPAKKRKAKD